MPSSPIASALAVAARALADAGAHDPLRLDLPPADDAIESLPPEAAGMFGALYLVAHVDDTGLLLVAEALADRRASLPINDVATAQALERFHRSRRRWYEAQDRDALWSRLFGMGEAAAAGDAAANTEFEGLLVAFSDAVADAAYAGAGGREAITLSYAGGRLRANLAPRRYGNTAFAARSIEEELRAAVEILARPAVGALYGVTGVWATVREAFGPDAPDIGRLLEKGRHGQTLLRAIGTTVTPASLSSELATAAIGWLAASGFEAPSAPRASGNGRGGLR